MSARSQTAWPPKRFVSPTTQSLSRLTQSQRKSDSGDDPMTAASKKDPTLPVSALLQPVKYKLCINVRQAKMHGNEPSKGAKIDADLQADDEEYLKQKGKK